VNWSSAPERFIEQQDIRIVYQRTAQVCPLHHAARKLPGALVGKVLETDLRKQRVCPVPVFAALLDAEIGLERWYDLERQHHIVANRHPGQQRCALKRHAHPNRLGTQFAPAKKDVACGRPQQLADKLQDGRFPTAGGSDKGQEIAPLDSQAGGLQGFRLLRPLAKRHADILKFDKPGLAHVMAPAPSR
jgi:hypothetical protein